MKKLGILVLACITALNLWAEEFKIGKLTFEIATPTTVGLIDADKDIINVFLSETIDYKGNSYTLTNIGSEAFERCTSLTSVTIPNSVTIIANEAFEDCSGLTSITIPNSVTSIGREAFYGTAFYNNPSNWDNGALYLGDCLIRLTDGYVGDYKIKVNTLTIADGAFADCKGLTSITIPNSVTRIGDWAFENCFSLTSITIPNSVKEIGNGAFEGCESLTSITIPNSVTWIGHWAFGGTAFYNNPSNWDKEALYLGDCLICLDCGYVGDYNIKENTRLIADGAFAFCKGLTSITIPNSVTEIGNGAFEVCHSLTSITIPNTVTSIGHGAFYFCSGLTSITIPNSVTSIGYEAFSGCKSLTSITIPNSVKEIGNLAFEGCESLTSITIPNSVTWIGHWAFEDCSSLKSVKVPSHTKIGRKAFPSRTRIIRR